MKVSRALIAAAMVTLALPVCAQSLGDLAKKEQERRKAAPPAAKVYTNDDLKKITVPGGTPEADGPAKPGDKADPQAKGDAKADTKGDAKAAEPALDEAAWRAKMTAAREDVHQGEMFRDALQSQINGLTADFTA